MCVDVEGFRDDKNDGPFSSETQTNSLDPDILWKIDMMSELGVFKREAGDVGNPVSSPIVIDDLVFCVTGHGREYGGRAGLLPAAPEPPSFLAADKRTGKAVWTSNAPGTNIVFSQWSSPVHAHLDGVDQVIFPGGDAVLYGFEAKSGKLLWKFDCQRPNGSPSPLNGERAGLPTEGSAKVGVRGEAVRLMSHFMGESKNFFVATPVVSD